MTMSWAVLLVVLGAGLFILRHWVDTRKPKPPNLKEPRFTAEDWNLFMKLYDNKGSSDGQENNP